MGMRHVETTLGDIFYPGSAPGSPVEGQVYYDSAAHVLKFRNASAWVDCGGGSGGTTMGSFGSSPNANGGTITAGVLHLQPADGSNPGGVSTTTQSFAGTKTFSNIISPTVYNTNGGSEGQICVKVGTSVVNSSAIGTLFSVRAGIGGTEVEAFSVMRDYVQVAGDITANNLSGTNTGDQDLSVKANLSGATFTGAISATNLSGTNTGDGTITSFGSTPNANGGTITSGALQLQPASATYPGGVSTTTQTFAGTKTFNNGISSSNSSSYGVEGISTSSYAVYGHSTNDYGGYFTSTNGVAIGSVQSGTQHCAYLQSANGDGLVVTTTGSGKGINVSAINSTAIYGLGTTGIYGSGSSYGGRFTSGTFGVYAEATSNGTGLSSNSPGSGHAIQSIASGSGNAISAVNIGTGIAVSATASGNVAAEFYTPLTGTVRRAPLNLGSLKDAILSQQPTMGIQGDFYLGTNSSEGTFYIRVCTSSGTPGTWALAMLTPG